MPKRLLFAIVLVVVILTGTVTLLFLGSGQKTTKSEIDAAVNQARFLYSQRRGDDFSKGPCLSDALMPGWVLDIAHSPRIPLDDLPQNQCPAYVEGKAQHFVELDPEGNLIRAR